MVAAAPEDMEEEEAPEDMEEEEAPEDMEEEEEFDLLVNVDEQEENEEMDDTDDEVGKIDILAVDYATRHNMSSCLYSCLASFFSSTRSRVHARTRSHVLTLLCRAGSGHSGPNLTIRVSQKIQKSKFWNGLYPSGFHRLDEPPEKISAL